MPRARSARRAAVVGAAVAAAAAVVAAAVAGQGAPPAPPIADNAETADDTSVAVGIVPDDMPAVGDDTDGKRHYVIVASDSPDVGP